MKKFKKLYTVSHRGKEGTNFGVHARIPLQLRDLSVNALLVLAFIDIHQFKDRTYKIMGVRQHINLENLSYIINISKDSVKRAIKELEKRKAITVLKRKGDSNAYISNILKFKVKYQIITATILGRKDISHLAKSLIFKLIMFNTERVNNIGNISALTKEIDMSRPSIYKVLKELDNLNYIIEIENGIFAIDIERLLTDSDMIILIELGELRKRVKELSKEIQSSGK